MRAVMGSLALGLGAARGGVFGMHWGCPWGYTGRHDDGAAGAAEAVVTRILCFFRSLYGGTGRGAGRQAGEAERRFIVKASAMPMPSSNAAAGKQKD